MTAVNADNIEASSGGQANVAGRDIMQGDARDAERDRVARETRDAVIELVILIKGTDHTEGLIDRITWTEHRVDIAFRLLWFLLALTTFFGVSQILHFVAVGGAW